jgi:hypothetical protein
MFLLITVACLWIKKMKSQEKLPVGAYGWNRSPFSTIEVTCPWIFPANLPAKSPSVLAQVSLSSYPLGLDSRPIWVLVLADCSSGADYLKITTN